MKKSLRVTNSDISLFLAKYILRGQVFHTPVRETCPMWQTVWNNPIVASTISSRLEDCHDGYFNYDVLSYNTIIMRVQMIKDSDGSFHVVSAYLDDRKYSHTTGKMQGYCIKALRDLFDGLGYIPAVIGKRGGKYPRYNYMAVIGSKENGYSWGVLDTDTGEIHALNQDGDTYNGDTEGYY